MIDEEHARRITSFMNSKKEITIIGWENVPGNLQATFPVCPAGGSTTNFEHTKRAIHTTERSKLP